MNKKDLNKISDYLWEIPQSFKNSMRVPARIYASEQMLDNILRDRSLEQLINVASLPGIVNYSISMPDTHQGYGFPIGGVAAIRTEDGVISPGGVGYDINCGMRILKSDYSEEDIKPYLNKLATEIQKQVPSGLGKGGKIKLSIEQINKILEGGAKRLIEQGYGEKEDIENCEANGCLSLANASNVSDYAKNRGRDQVGTLGSGNHFLEIQKVAEIFDKKIAQVFGLFEGQIVVMIHTGSRGLGHQIATDYIKIMEKAMPQYGIRLPDKELAACPINSSEGKKYFSAMACGANYAWANRQMITSFIRKAWNSILKGSLVMLYDVAHNIAKIERYKIDGSEIEVYVHRKGATRAFPPENPDIPEKYREVGQPVLIPGSMGTASYILSGSESGKQAFYSASHGAGRIMSRHAAIKAVSGKNLIKDLESKGIIIKCKSSRGIAEEAPIAYKDIEQVVEVVHKAGLSRKIAKLSPLAVIKGE